MASAKTARSQNTNLLKRRGRFFQRKIEDQVEAFCLWRQNSEIPLGVSGQVATSGPRHITLGKRHSN